MSQNLISEGLNLMSLGMGFVFVFLIFLVIVVSQASKVINKLFPVPETPKNKSSQAVNIKADDANDKLVSVITAAIHHHKVSAQK